MAYSILCFHVWLHVACVAHVEQGYVTSGRGMSVFQSDGFNAWWMKLGPFLLQLVIRWPITDRLFFCSSLSCVRVHVCWLRGVPCNKLLRVVVQRKRCFVSTFESPPAVDLSI